MKSDALEWQVAGKTVTTHGARQCGSRDHTLMLSLWSRVPTTTRLISAEHGHAIMTLAEHGQAIIYATAYKQQHPTVPCTNITVYNHLVQDLKANRSGAYIPHANTLLSRPHYAHVTYHTPTAQAPHMCLRRHSTFVAGPRPGSLRVFESEASSR